MTFESICHSLKESFQRIVVQNNLSSSQIEISCTSLSPEEAIGTTKRKDFPILTGNEIMIQALYRDAAGQAFTDSPAAFTGNLEEILHMDIVNDAHARGLFVATMNAVMRHVGLVQNTIHCKDSAPELCAQKFVTYVRENYGSPKLALIGYQPALIEHLSKAFELRVLDLNPINVSKVKFDTLIEHGVDDFAAVVLHWSDLVLCTGSTICNGSITNFMDVGKEVVFFGTTLAGAAELLGLKRVCPCSA